MDRRKMQERETEKKKKTTLLKIERQREREREREREGNEITKRERKNGIDSREGSNNGND